MDIYNLTKVASMTGHPPRSEVAYGFNIIGVHGRLAFSYEHREQAEAAHKLIAEAIAKAKRITPMRLGASG
jgi:hypothetical protein